MNTLELIKPSTPSRAASDPDPEVPAKARRRRFTAKYKLGILEEADNCTQPGERRVAELERENTRLRDQLEKAQTIISVQKKLSRLLESPSTEAC